jgi:hypothetical protein
LVRTKTCNDARIPSEVIMQRVSRILSSLLIVYAALVSANCLRAQPQIEIIGGDKVDWGNTYAGVLSAKVRVINNGDLPLRIDTVQPACGCTIAPIDRKIILHGDTAVIDLSVDAIHEFGLLAKTLSIESNDPKRPSLTLLLTAQLKRDLTLEPTSYFVMGEMLPGDSDQVFVRIKNESAARITLDPPITAEGGYCTLSFVQRYQVVLGAGDSVIVPIKIRATHQGTYIGEVRFPNSSTHNHDLRMSIVATVTGPQESGKRSE